MIKKLAAALLFSLALFLAGPVRVQAQEMSKPPEYSRGIIKEILSQAKIPFDEKMYYTQRVLVERGDTHEKIIVDVGTDFQPLNETQRMKVGTQVVLAYQESSPDKFEYVISDIYRIPVLVWLAAIFVLLVLIIARRQGALSLVGMGLSFLVLTQFVLPQIIAGQNPVFISLAGCGAVAVLAVYLSHGFSLESHISVASMMLTLAAVALLSVLAIKFGVFSGLGNEEASYLQFGATARINLQGLLLGGVLLGTLGVLDDICIAQVSIVRQLKEAKPDIHFHELYARSLAVGKDHVASLVNTLVLAYAGSSLPLFLLFTLNTAQPWWVSLNSEIIAEEVVRTFVGSIGLVLAVPLSTLAASYLIPRLKLSPSKTTHHHH